ncbi:MAG: YeeE/YedE family protein, partial [Phreatobacter sp.]|nr:YeeE/YedE family protein [Phreatobacter sp.]
LNFATLLVAGRPWGVTQAFALWGSKAVEAAGLADPVFWAFWEEPTRVEALLRPLTADATSVMNVAVMAGALVAALLAGRFAPSVRVPAGAVLGSVIGGLLIGAGAIVATGCNISAFFSGIASGSLHGWLWIAAALPGNWLGMKLRPLFGLDGALSR